MTFIPNTILIHYGEIHLKGKNRPLFQKILQRNLTGKLRSLGLDWKVSRQRDHYHINLPQDGAGSLEPVMEALGQVAGVAWYAPARRIDGQDLGLLSDQPKIEMIERQILELADDDFRPDASFRVRVDRAEKRFVLNSVQLETRLGGLIREQTAWDRVDLNHPDHVFQVNIKPEAVFVHSHRRPGMGGLPVGMSGRVLALLSGGIDSPAAAYLLARRGCNVDFLHFTATPLQLNQAVDYQVSRLAAALSQYTVDSRLFLAPSSFFQVAMLGADTEYELVLFRRFMIRAAEVLAQSLGAQALALGDSLGQVASQTMENIATANQASTLPLFRPLLTYEKQEIIDLAKRIGTFETSILPYKDCCALMARHPKTKSDPKSVASREQALLPEYEALVERTLADAVRLDYHYGQLVETT